MDAGVLLLVGLVGLVVALAIGEAIWRRGQRKPSLTEMFGGTDVKRPGTFDEQGMTEESRAALSAQMRLTAQAGVQGLGRHNQGLGKWSVLNPEAMSDPEAYAKMMVPGHARNTSDHPGDLETSKDHPHSSDNTEKDAPR